ncbi:hypothetical protein JCM11641_002843 [Rhodosporidiobolus odoratus]
MQYSADTMLVTELEIDYRHYEPAYPSPTLTPFTSAQPPFLSGVWQIGWSAVKLNCPVDRFALIWDGVTTRVRIRGGNFTVHDAAHPDRPARWGIELQAGLFPPTDSGRIESVPMSSPNYVLLQLSIEFQDGADPSPANEPVEVRGHLAETLLHGPAASNVLLNVPRQKRQVWTSEAVLRQAPYFATLLSSGFAEKTSSDAPVLSSASNIPDFDDSDHETDTRFPPISPLSPTGLARPLTTTVSHSPACSAKSGQARSSLASLPISEPSFHPNSVKVVRRLYTVILPRRAFLPSNWEDSDEEKDAALPGKTSSTRPSFFGSLPPHKVVTITESCYSTDLAVICWMQSGTSVQLLLPLPDPFALPSPVSPKSVYRLAHLLKLAPLCTLALDNFRSQLTMNNVIEELFSPIAESYDEIRAAACDCAYQHSRGLVDSEGMKKMEDKLNLGQLSLGQAEVLDHAVDEDSEEVQRHGFHRNRGRAKNAYQCNRLLGEKL